MYVCVCSRDGMIAAVALITVGIAGAQQRQNNQHCVCADINGDFLVFPGQSGTAEYWRNLHAAYLSVFNFSNQIVLFIHAV